MSIPFSANWPPNWRAIGDTESQLFPYSATCQIAVNGSAVGTGWLIASKVVVTAGHVVEGAQSCSLKFPSWTNWRPSNAIRRRGQPDEMPPGSPSDIACIVLAEDAHSIRPMPISSPPVASEVQVLGYFGGTLFESKGLAKTFAGSMMAHNADTHPDGGQSGSAVLIGDTAVAVHLGASSISLPYLAAADKLPFGNYLNSALTLNQQITEFIQDIIGTTNV